MFNLNRISALILIAPAFLVVGAAGAAFGQCPTGTSFPTALDTPATLTVAVNNLGTNLTATLGPSDTTMVVSSTAGWVPYMMATVDTGANMEIVFVTSINSGTVLGISHPCENTTAISHSAGVPVVNNVTAYAGSTGPKSAIYALESFVYGGGLNGVINSGAQYQVPYYSTSPTGTAVSGDTGLTYNQPSATLTATNLTISSLTGSTQCLQVSTLGVVTGTGSACGSGGGGSGTVNPGTQYQVAYYPNTASAVSGHTGFTWNGTTVTVPALTITGFTTGCLNNTSGVVASTGVPCGSIGTASTSQVAVYSGANAIGGFSGFTYSSSILTVPSISAGSIKDTGFSSAQCVQTNSSGVFVGSGAACPTVSGTNGYVAFYTGSTSLGSDATFNYNSTTHVLFGSQLDFSSGIITGTLDITNAQITGLTVNGGGNTVYRCVSSGALPAGALTTNSASCGVSSTSTNISVN